MLSIDTLANVILNNGRDVSNKKLQKLSYYVYAWNLAINGVEIAEMSFEAWEHGPVCRKLYSKYKKYGWNTIPKYEGFVLASDRDIKFVQSVLLVYDQYNADELEVMAHNEKPWIEARRGLHTTDVCNTIISKDTIRNFYASQTRIRDEILRGLKVV